MEHPLSNRYRLELRLQRGCWKACLTSSLCEISCAESLETHPTSRKCCRWGPRFYQNNSNTNGEFVHLELLKRKKPSPMSGSLEVISRCLFYLPFPSLTLEPQPTTHLQRQDARQNLLHGRAVAGSHADLDGCDRHRRGRIHALPVVGPGRHRPRQGRLQ